MIDPLSMAIGALVFAGGAALGRINRPARKPEPVRPICACTHSLGAHEGGPCRAQVRREHYDSIGSRNGYEWKPCACHKYTGPEHVLTVWTPPAPTEMIS